MIVGLDVGGTHADVVLLGNAGVLNEVKVPTDPDNLFETVLSALDQITAGIDPHRIERMVMSTTLTTNAIIQQKLPAVGMVVSGGPGIDPAFYRTNDHYACVAGSIDHRGREVKPIDPAEIEVIRDEFLHAGIRNVGVVTKFSTRNPCQETAIAHHLENAFDQVFLGHRISGNLSFPLGSSPLTSMPRSTRSTGGFSRPSKKHYNRRAGRFRSESSKPTAAIPALKLPSIIPPRRYFRGRRPVSWAR